MNDHLQPNELVDRSAVINYFRDCFKSDTRAFVLNNFFSSKVAFGHVIEGTEELLCGHLNRLPLDPTYADEVIAKIALQKKEKALYLFSFFVSGADTGIMDKKHKICAPLFIHPARIVESDGLYFLDVDFSKTFLNINFVSKLTDQPTEDFYKALNDAFEYGELNFAGIGRLKRALEEFVPDFNGEELLHYPELTSEKSLRKSIHLRTLKSQKGYRAYPAVAIGALDKTDSTRGVLNELNELAEHPDQHSVLLRALLQDQWPETEPLKMPYVPESLSPAQQDVVKAVNHHVLTQVTGPPGTGKSHTIAALAVNFVSQGRSVLVAGKTEEAVTVVRKKIAEDFDLGDVLIHKLVGAYKIQLKNQLEKSLYRIKNEKNLQVAYKNQGLATQLMDELTRQIASYEKDLSKTLEKDMEWGQYLGENRGNSGLFTKIKKQYIGLRQSYKSSIWLVTGRLFELLDQLHEAYLKYVKVSLLYHQCQSLENNRKHYTKFNQYLQDSYRRRKINYIDEIDFNEVFKSLPLWFSKANLIANMLPMQKEMFDLAIIDEATQCDIATILPILQRAKRAVIVGDPKQLRHISFLSGAYQNELMRKYQLPESEFSVSYDYRRLSILDMVNHRLPEHSQVVFLNEHYRSNPDIIHFSNQEFYGNSLTVMTDHPERRGVVSTHFVQTNGVRDEKGVNDIEARNLIGKMKLLIFQLEQEAHPVVKTIGILSPFRAQVDYLNKLIVATFDTKIIYKYDLLCGTAYSFQGEERDVMFISFCVDAATNASAYHHLNKDDVFNVSITRARNRQYVFLSVLEKDLKPGLLRDLIGQKWQYEHVAPTDRVDRDHFLEEVIAELTAADYEVEVDCPVAGCRLDILVTGQGLCFGVNVIGFPGSFVQAHDLEELKRLHRSGIRVFPLPYGYWYFDKAACLKELIRFAESIRLKEIVEDIED